MSTTTTTPDIHVPETSDRGPAAETACRLADEAGQVEHEPDGGIRFTGPLGRLVAGLRSVAGRRDRNTRWHVTVAPIVRAAGFGPCPSSVAEVTVTVWSRRGYFAGAAGQVRPRAWWAQATAVVDVDEHGQVGTRPVGDGVIVVGSRRSGDSTRFHGALIAHAVCSAWQEYCRRDGIRRVLGEGIGYVDVAATAEEIVA